MAAKVDSVEINKWSTIDVALFGEFLRLRFGIYGVGNPTLFIFKYERALYFNLTGYFYITDDRKEQPSELMDLCLSLFDELSFPVKDWINSLDSTCDYILNAENHLARSAANDWMQVHRDIFSQETRNYKSWDFFEISLEVYDGTDKVYEDVWLKQTRLGHRETDRNVKPKRYLEHLTANAETFRLVEPGMHE